MSQEAVNVFERAKAKPALQADRQNRFERHDAAHAEQKKAAHEADVSRRVARNAEQRRSWVGDGRKQNSAVGSTTLNADLAELKRASDASRAAAKNPQPAPQAQWTLATMTAVIDSWIMAHPELYDSPHNRKTLRNALAWETNRTNSFSYELLDEVYAFLLANNYVEQKPGPRKRGFFISAPAPREYPEFVSDGERQAEEQAAAETAQAQEATNTDAARSMPFAELAKLVQSSFKNIEHAHEVR